MTWMDTNSQAKCFTRKKHNIESSQKKKMMFRFNFHRASSRKRKQANRFAEESESTRYRLRFVNSPLPSRFQSATSWRVYDYLLDLPFPAKTKDIFIFLFLSSNHISPCLASAKIIFLMLRLTSLSIFLLFRLLLPAILATAVQKPHYSIQLLRTQFIFLSVFCGFFFIFQLQRRFFMKMNKKKKVKSKIAWKRIIKERMM